MRDVLFSVSEDAVLALKVRPEALGDELRLAAAIKLYELGRLSSGVAANLAGVPRVVFLSRLADFGVATFCQTEEELIQDLERA